MKRKLKIGLLFIVGAFVLLVVYAAIEVASFAKRDDARQADAAIVLGAAVFGDRPSPVLRERINHAILLYEQGLIDIIIFTGGKGNPTALSEAEVSARYAIAHGIPQEAIVLEDQSKNTIENLGNAQEIAAEKGLHAFLIVSTPFHMKRAMAIADSIGLTAYPSPTRTTKWISWHTKTRAYGREAVVYAAYLLENLFQR